MNAKDAILSSYGSAEMILNAYLGDLTDADLLVRPVPGQNHIAWQLGHLIESERNMLEAMKPGSSPDLPAGMDEGHGREATTVDDPAKYYSKARYLELMKAQRDATKQALAALPDVELDAPGPERMRDFCPTVGTTFLMMSSHVLMHLGQFVSVRRKLGKPVSI